MDELEVIRMEVERLLEQGRKPGLTQEQRQDISARVNVLWARLAGTTQAAGGHANADDPDAKGNQDQTIRFVI
ncbi:MAG: hypothetical protein ACLFV7_14330 [Phycisphaerae bacterium]